MSLTRRRVLELATTSAAPRSASCSTGRLRSSKSKKVDAGRHVLSRTRFEAVIPPCLTSETRRPVAVALERYQPVMAGRDAAIARELNRLIEGR
jgi:hypothetical protein